MNIMNERLISDICASYSVPSIYICELLAEKEGIADNMTPEEIDVFGKKCREIGEEIISNIYSLCAMDNFDQDDYYGAKMAVLDKRKLCAYFVNNDRETVKKDFKKYQESYDGKYALEHFFMNIDDTLDEKSFVQYSPWY